MDRSEWASVGKWPVNMSTKPLPMDAPPIRRAALSKPITFYITPFSLDWAFMKCHSEVPFSLSPDRSMYRYSPTDA
ncbi:hypothetical protein V3C99_016409 [Haemonchus contortus]